MSPLDALVYQLSGVLDSVGHSVVLPYVFIRSCDVSRENEEQATVVHGRRFEAESE